MILAGDKSLELGLKQLWDMENKDILYDTAGNKREGVVLVGDGEMGEEEGVGEGEEGGGEEGGGRVGKGRVEKGILDGLGEVGESLMRDVEDFEVEMMSKEKELKKLIDERGELSGDGEVVGSVFGDDITDIDGMGGDIDWDDISSADTTLTDDDTTSLSTATSETTTLSSVASELMKIDAMLKRFDGDLHRAEANMVDEAAIGDAIGDNTRDNIGDGIDDDIGDAFDNGTINFDSVDANNATIDDNIIDETIDDRISDTINTIDDTSDLFYPPVDPPTISSEEEEAIKIAVTEVWQANLHGRVDLHVEYFNDIAVIAEQKLEEEREGRNGSMEGEEEREDERTESEGVEKLTNQIEGLAIEVAAMSSRLTDGLQVYEGDVGISDDSDGVVGGGSGVVGDFQVGFEITGREGEEGGWVVEEWNVEGELRETDVGDNCNGKNIYGGNAQDLDYAVWPRGGKVAGNCNCIILLLKPILNLLRHTSPQTTTIIITSSPHLYITSIIYPD